MKPIRSPCPAFRGVHRVAFVAMRRGTDSNPPSPPFSKGGNLFSPFEKGGLRGIFTSNTVMLYSITQDYKKFHVFFFKTPSRSDIIPSYLFINFFASIDSNVPPPL